MKIIINDFKLDKNNLISYLLEVLDDMLIDEVTLSNKEASEIAERLIEKLDPKNLELNRNIEKNKSDNNNVFRTPLELNDMDKEALLLYIDKLQSQIMAYQTVIELAESKNKNWQY